MTHPRKTIRASAITALTGLTTTGTNVFESQVYPLADTQLPALRVYTRADTFGTLEREYTSVSATWGGYARQVVLVVEAMVKSASTPDATIDTICEEVETALQAKSAWTSNVGQVTYDGTDIEFSVDGEIRQAIATITYQISWFPTP